MWGYESWQSTPALESPSGECSDIHLRSPSEFDSDDSCSCCPTSVQNWGFWKEARRDHGTWNWWWLSYIYKIGTPFGMAATWTKRICSTKLFSEIIQGTKHHWEAPNPGSDIRIDSLFFQRSLSRSPKTGRSWSSAHSLGFLWPKLTPKAWWVKFFIEMQPCHEGFQRDNCICLSKWFGSKT